MKTSAHRAHPNSRLPGDGPSRHQDLGHAPRTGGTPETEALAQLEAAVHESSRQVRQRMRLDVLSAGPVQRQAADQIPEEQRKELEELGGAVQAKSAGSNGNGKVVQRAYTARRPLGGMLSFGLKNRWFQDKGVFHEHIFFEDGGTPANIGFMGKSGLGQDAGGGYTQILTGLNDPKMRQAVTQVGNPGAYELLGNNCQRYVTNVVAVYNTL